MAWNRLVDSFVDVVDLQISKAGDTITVNAGVVDVDVHTILWGRKPPEFVEQPACTVCIRIGELIDGKDMWWRLSDHETVHSVGANVAARVLPFLERMHSRRAMERWLIDTKVETRKYPAPILNLAILKTLLGEARQGCTLIDALQKKSIGAWQTRAIEVADRLRCDQSSGDSDNCLCNG